MNTCQIVIAFATFGLLASCTAPKGISIQQYGVMSRSSSSRGPITFQMNVKEPMRAPIQYAGRQLVMGKGFQVGAQREFVYPSAYEPARTNAGATSLAPATPTALKTVNTGITANLTAKEVGELILIEGEISVIEFRGFSRMGGSLGHPILDGKGRVITENRIEMPKFAKFSTPVYVAIKPGEASTFEVSAPRKGTTATFSLNRNK